MRTQDIISQKRDGVLAFGLSFLTIFFFFFFWMQTIFKVFIEFASVLVFLATRHVES